MRWPIVRLIWFRELRDQLRDRRTLFMMVVLPIVLYPVLALALREFALGFMAKPTTVGIQGVQYLPPLRPLSAGMSPVPAAALLSLTPAGPGSPGMGVDRIAGTAGLVEAAQSAWDNPPLIVSGLDGSWRFAEGLLESPGATGMLPIKALEAKDASARRALLQAKEVDVILVVPPDFQKKLQQGRRPLLEIESREADERSELGERRMQPILGRWKKLLKEVRLRQAGLPADFDEPVEIKDPEKSKPPLELAARGLRDQLIRIFPFMLVMWSLAGALYPAVDVCAGEKERGTMETLLISPASRQEIVWGKFLTIWLISTATTLWNLVCMAGTTWAFSSQLPQAIIGPAAVLWCVVSVLPLTAFFGALCLAMGVYARSSKEGQYYLMPLFLVTMPLVFLTLAPDVELNAFYSLVPVTGVALLMQRLMLASAWDQVPWLYFIPVLAAVTAYSLLALRWAVEQFKREEVLFREAERLDVGLWLGRLFREKEGKPSVGQALFCFALILGLRWWFGSTGGHRPLLPRTAIAYLALAAPPLFMALLLTRRPWKGLGLRLPPPRSLVEPVLLAVLLLPPLLELGDYIRRQLPELEELLAEQQPLASELRTLGQELDSAGTSRPTDRWWQYFLVLALLPAVCEELAFRGFIFTGLRTRFSAEAAILLNGFMFALYHLNIFQFLPAFAAGVVLSLFTARSGSILPGVLFHFAYSSLPVVETLWPRLGHWGEGTALAGIIRPVGVILCSLLAAALLLRLSRQPFRFRILLWAASRPADRP